MRRSCACNSAISALRRSTYSFASVVSTSGVGVSRACSSQTSTRPSSKRSSGELSAARESKPHSRTRLYCSAYAGSSGCSLLQQQVARHARAPRRRAGSPGRPGNARSWSCPRAGCPRRSRPACRARSTNAGARPPRRSRPSAPRSGVLREQVLHQARAQLLALGALRRQQEIVTQRIVIRGVGDLARRRGRRRDRRLGRRRCTAAEAEAEAERKGDKKGPAHERTSGSALQRSSRAARRTRKKPAAPFPDAFRGAPRPSGYRVLRACVYHLGPHCESGDAVFGAFHGGRPLEDGTCACAAAA